MKRRALPVEPVYVNGNGHLNGHSADDAEQEYEEPILEDRRKFYSDDELYSPYNNWSMVERSCLAKYGVQPPQRWPIKYRSWMPRMIYQLRLLGASNRKLAEACGVTEKTIWEWAHGPSFIPLFREAFEQGGDLADAMVIESMFHRALGYSHPETKVLVVDKTIQTVNVIKHYPPDSHAGEYILNNRQKGMWRTRTTNEMTGADGQPLVPPQLVIMPVSPGTRTNGKDHE